MYLNVSKNACVKKVFQKNEEIKMTLYFLGILQFHDNKLQREREIGEKSERKDKRNDAVCMM